MLYLFKQGYRKQLPLLIGTAVLTVLSFSAYAYSVLLVALLIYLLITNKNRGKMMLVLAGCLLVVVVGVPFLLETFHVSGYFTDRFQFNFAHLIATDNSMFVRSFSRRSDSSSLRITQFSAWEAAFIIGNLQDSCSSISAMG